MNAADTNTDPKTEAKAAGPKAEVKASATEPDTKETKLKPEDKSAESKLDSKPVKPKPDVRNKILFSLSILGILAGLVGAYLFGRERKAQPPVFQPVSSPYESAIYANGIVESEQASGENINLFPEVSGPITRVLVSEGKPVVAGAVLFTIDDSVQKATTEQLRLQSEAALALLEELKAEPRLETLAIAKAQVDLAIANLTQARDPYDKLRAASKLNSDSISKDALDMAKDAFNQATVALDVSRKQYDLIEAGAWSYDITSQSKQYAALKQAYNAANALLQKYSIRAPVDGVVLAVNAALGGYVSSQGAYDTYTELYDPVMVMGTPQEHMAVRCYVDEILVSRLPSPFHIHAQMQITGTDIKVPLEFVRVQPYVSPKIELSNQRQEQVDLRVLPVIFRFEKKDVPVYPGLMVDVYIGKQ
jgi:HlyD family secretion protein